MVVEEGRVVGQLSVQQRASTSASDGHGFCLQLCGSLTVSPGSVQIFAKAQCTRVWKGNNN